VLNLAPKQRAVLLPAAPLLGAVVLVIVLHLTSLLVGVGVGIWIAVALAAAALVAAVVRNRSWRFVPARSLLAAGMVLAVGAIGAVIALLPSFIADSALAIQPSANNDAFYYVSVARWVLDNPITQSPLIGSGPLSGADSPAYGPALESLRLGLRVGQELVNAGVSSLMGLPPVATMSPMLGLYVLLIPGGAWVLGAAFRLPAVARLILGGMLVTSFSLINQTLNQNSDSILGIALLPLVLGLCALVLFRQSDQKPAAPVWLAAISLAALVGTYTEFVPFLFATLGFLAVVGPLATLKTRVLRALGVLALSVVLGPVIWFRAVQGLVLAATLSGRQASDGPSPTEAAWLFTGPYQALLRGYEPAMNGLPTAIAVIGLFAAIVVGVVLALLRSRTRGIAIGGAIAASAGAVVIVSRGDEYISGRAIDMVTPLLIIVAVLGWAGLGRWTIAIPRRPLAVGLTAVVVIGGLAGVAVGARVASTSSILHAQDDRIVTDDFAEAGEWIADLGDPEGADVAVAVGTQYDQLWISDALATMPDVSYINLRGDLGYRSAAITSYWDAEPNRYVLVGPGAYATYSADAVLEQNARFTLLDLSRDATVAVPAVDTANWFWVLDQEGGISSLAAARVQVLTSRDDLAGVSLTLTGISAGDTVEFGDEGESLASAVATDGDLALPLGEVPVVNGLADVYVRPLGETGTFTLSGVSGG